MRGVIIAAGLSLALSACGSDRPQGAGFTGIGAEGTVTSAARPAVGSYGHVRSASETVAVRRTPDGRTVKTYTYGAPPLPRAQPAVAPGPSSRAGVPVFDYAVKSRKANSGAIAVLTSGRSAIGYMSSRWGPEYAVPIEAGDGTAKLRIVNVNGLSFGVVRKLRRPFLGPRMSNADYGQAVVRAVTQRTGCSYAGRTVVRKDQYATPSGFAVHLQC